MSVDSAITWLTWILALVGAAALVGVVLTRRWAGRIAVLAAAALLAVAMIAVRVQLTHLPEDSPSALCTGGVSWFGIHLHGSDEFCAPYR